MPNSLKCKIKHLCHNGTLTQSECERLLRALEQEPCEDCVSRQAVLDGVDRYIYKSQSTGTQDDFYSFAELVVKALPPVTPKQRTGIDCVLDKIRAEIRDLAYYVDGEMMIEVVDIQRVLDLIDKHKAESEEEK